MTIFLWFENGSLCAYIHVHLYLCKAISYINRTDTSIIFISKAYCTNNTANRDSVNSKSGEHSLAQNEKILSPSLWIYGYACNHDHYHVRNVFSRITLHWKIMFSHLVYHVSHLWKMSILSLCLDLFQTHWKLKNMCLLFVLISVIIMYKMYKITFVVSKYFKFHEKMKKKNKIITPLE